MNFHDLKPKIIELVRDNDEIDILWLYGSYAKGTAHEGSDIDLAVVFKTWQKDIIERRLRSEILAIK